MSAHSFRDEILFRLTQDLVGPLSPHEIISDRPSQRYSTGILYPRNAPIQPEEDEDGGEPVNVNEDASELTDPGVSLHAALKPASAGLSFAMQGEGRDADLPLRVKISCATYRRFSVNENGQESSAPPVSRTHERWRRIPLTAEIEIKLGRGEARIDLSSHGIEGLQLYCLLTPHANIKTITLALVNTRSRGESSALRWPRASPR